MSKLKVFWKEQCPNCITAKNLAKECENAGKKVEYYNVETSDGLAEGSFYNVLSTPTLVITDTTDNYIHSWSGNVPVLNELILKLV